MRYNIDSDADLDALFREASEAVQTHYESILWWSVHPEDQVTPGSSTRKGDALSVLNRPNPLQSDA